MKNQFKEGDTVVRIATSYGDTKLGEIYTVAEVISYVAFILVGVDGTYSPQSFKIFNDEGYSSINTKDS